MSLNGLGLVVLLSLMGTTDAAPKVDWMPLCKKVELADFVFEATFKIPQNNDKSSLKSDASAATSLAQRGKISRVVKGELSVEGPWEEAFGNPFKAYTSAYLEKLLEGRDALRMVVFLKKAQKQYVVVGGAETQLGCQSSSHLSWCPSYVDYWKQVQACRSCLEKSIGQFPRCY